MAWVAVAVTVTVFATGWAFGFLVPGVFNGENAIDQSVIRYLVGHRAAWLTTAMLVATWLGSTVVLVPFVLALGVTARVRTRSWAVGAQLVVALGGAVALNNLIKPLVGRTRPDVDPLVSTVSGFAFPSGHATQSAAVAVTLAILASVLTPSRSWRVAVWSAAVLTTLVVAFSRVYLGVHWPTDVLAGSALGGLWAVLTAGALRWPGPTTREPGQGGKVRRWAPLRKTG